MDTLVLQFEKQKHFPFLLPARDLFLYKRENLTKWKHKQLTMWNLTLISISLCFFSVSFSLSYCKKLSSTINFNQSWLVCFLVLEKKIIHGPLPSISQTFMGHVAGHRDHKDWPWLQLLGGCEQWSTGGSYREVTSALSSRIITWGQQ